MDTITQDRTDHERAHAELIEAREVAANNYAQLQAVRAENVRLRAALQRIADGNMMHSRGTHTLANIIQAHYREADAALAATK